MIGVGGIRVDRNDERGNSADAVGTAARGGDGGGNVCRSDVIGKRYTARDVFEVCLLYTSPSPRD